MISSVSPAVARSRSSSRSRFLAAAAVGDPLDLPRHAIVITEASHRLDLLQEEILPTHSSRTRFPHAAHAAR